MKRHVVFSHQQCGHRLCKQVDHDEKLKGNAPENQLIHKISLCLMNTDEDEDEGIIFHSNCVLLHLILNIPLLALFWEEKTGICPQFTVHSGANTSNCYREIKFNQGVQNKVHYFSKDGELHYACVYIVTAALFLSP